LGEREDNREKERLDRKRESLEMELRAELGEGDA
jgi:hypothetical protein